MILASLSETRNPMPWRWQSSSVMMRVLIGLYLVKPPSLILAMVCLLFVYLTNSSITQRWPTKFFLANNKKESSAVNIYIHGVKFLGFVTFNIDGFLCPSVCLFSWKLGPLLIFVLCTNRTCAASTVRCTISTAVLIFWLFMCTDCASAQEYMAFSFESVVFYQI